MSNILRDRDEMMEVFEFLEGCKVRVQRTGKSIECQIVKVRRGSVLSTDATVSLPGMIIVTKDHGEIPVRMPHMIEETQTSFILDYNAPPREMTEDEERANVEREDRHFYEFLRRGKGHKYGGDRMKIPPIVIEILED